jgi:hypothetical protein
MTEKDKMKQQLKQVLEMQYTLEGNKSTMDPSDPDYDWVLQEETRLRNWKKSLEDNLKNLP